jgi:hypothetical protein
LDPTTFTGGEVAGSVLAGAGKGAATGATIGTAIGTIIPGAGNIAGGGIGAAIGAAVGVASNVIGEISGRNKARREAKRKYDEAMYESKIKVTGQRGQQLAQQSMMRSQDAALGQAEIADKFQVNMEDGGQIYSEPYLRFRGKMDKGARVEAPVAAGTRPIDLMTAKYQKGGYINYENGGFTTENVGRIGLDAAGIFNPVAAVASGALDMKDAYKYYKEGDTKQAFKSAGLGLLSLVPVGGSAVKTALKSTKYAKGIAQASQALKVPYKVSKATKVTGKTDKHYNKVVDKGGVDKVNMENQIVDSPVGPLPETPMVGEMGMRITYNAEDYYTDDFKKFLNGGMMEEMKTGGMTPGEFSHKTNPLTVVDKAGNDTGMELTGGEGVFDKGAMTKLDKYKKSKNFEEAGKLVFSEMDSWKAAGTAKYGTRIK